MSSGRWSDGEDAESMDGSSCPATGGVFKSAANDILKSERRLMSPGEHML